MFVCANIARTGDQGELLRENKKYLDWNDNYKNPCLLCYLLDIHKRPGLLQPVYRGGPIRNAIHFELCKVAIKVDNKVFHTVLAIVFLVYEFSYILRLF